MTKQAAAKPLLDPGPTVRLAHCGPPNSLVAGLGPAPVIRLALGGTHSNDKRMAMEDPTTLPALLVSFFYLEPFLKNRARYHYRDWVMDSGAFSAHNSGATIDLSKYIDKCQELSGDPKLTEVFALDVIGDWRASDKNCEAMWARGVRAIPTYHVGEPVAHLLAMAKAYPKIALGGAVGYKQKDAWAAQCFSRIWPKKIHGLGFGSEKSLLSLPWHSVDATNWEIGPCKFGRWAAFGKMSVRGSDQNLRGEVLHYLEMERKARGRWRKEMAMLEEQGPTVRLVANANPGLEKAKAEAFTSAPTVRLAIDATARPAVDANAASGRHALSAFGDSEAPTVPLAMANTREQSYSGKYVTALGSESPTVRLATNPGRGKEGYAKAFKPNPTS